MHNLANIWSHIELLSPLNIQSYSEIHSGKVSEQSVDPMGETVSLQHISNKN